MSALPGPLRHREDRERARAGREMLEIPHGKKTWPCRSQCLSAAGKLSHTAAGTAGGLNPERITQDQTCLFENNENNVPSP